MFRILTWIISWGLFFVLVAVPTFAQEFQREANTIPVFIDGMLVHSPFAGAIISPRPTFVDIDGDGDIDLFLGNSGGFITFYRNTGTSANPIFTFESENYAEVDVGFASTPTFSDIDNDGDFDLLVGENDGNINFYRNTGTSANPIFIFESENYAEVDVGFASAPTFSDIDNDGDFDLFVGENDGNINFYRNTGTSANPIFTFESENFAEVDVSFASAPTFSDIDNDGDFDLLVGGRGFVNFNFYRNNGSSTNHDFSQEIENYISIKFSDLATPTFADIDNDGDLDLFVGEILGNINFFRNTGTATSPTFTLETTSFANINVGGEGGSTPTFADIDNDGDLDLFVGEHTGNINFYRNTGTDTDPTFILESENFASINVGSRNVPTFADIDNDGDLDMFVGHEAGKINFYENTGTPTNPTFPFEANLTGIDVGTNSSPSFTDIDNDGDLDLFVGEDHGNINFYRNTGTASNPIFTLETENFASIVVKALSTPTFTDIDNDGDPDLFIGESIGGLHFYRNVSAPTSVSDPVVEVFPNTFNLSQNYPNPFNPETTIQYQLPKASMVRLVIFNFLGQQVATLVNKEQEGGFYDVQWDGTDDTGRVVASGVYLSRLEAKEFSKVKKLILLR